MVSPSRLRKDENNVVVGVLHTAFERKPDEEGLSVTWLEYFAGTRAVQEVAAVHAMRASNITPGKNAAFAVGNVGAIADTCAERGHKVRIVHWPEQDNKAHAEIRQLPRDDLQLLERLAATVWASTILNSDVPPGAAQAPAEPAPRAQ
ncbi:MAG: hypothetical protein ACT4N2_08080 [Hyphomicrobium sp.]